MSDQISNRLNQMIRLIDLDRPIEELGVEVTPKVRATWKKIERDVASIKASGKGVAVPVEYEDFVFLARLSKVKPEAGRE